VHSSIEIEAMNMNSFRLPDSTRIGYVHLRVSDLKQSLAFYRDLLGFKKVKRLDTTVHLSASDEQSPIVMLTEESSARPRPPHSAGLFHAAFILPDRKELAKMFKRLYDHQWPFEGFADHGVSEALYLADPDGNGIEIYADRPRAQWPRRHGELQMGTSELDLKSLFSELRENGEAWTGIHPNTTIGHIHLQVSNLQKAEHFYHHLLGFDITQQTFPGALFLSAGGYHHHIGLNIWNSKDGSPLSPNTLGLTRFGIQMPDRQAKRQLKERVQRSDFWSSGVAGRLLLRDGDGIEIEIS
jgi:catechol 2,3-dioxygenase